LNELPLQWRSDWSHYHPSCRSTHQAQTPIFVSGKTWSCLPRRAMLSLFWYVFPYMFSFVIFKNSQKCFFSHVNTYGPISTKFGLIEWL
jgi:hypothetical protein